MSYHTHHNIAANRDTIEVHCFEWAIAHLDKVQLDFTITKNRHQKWDVPCLTQWQLLYTAAEDKLGN